MSQTTNLNEVDFEAVASLVGAVNAEPDKGQTVWQADVHWALDTPALTIDLHEKLETPDANNATITIDFTYTHGTATVQLKGTVTVVVSPAVMLMGFGSTKKWLAESVVVNECSRLVAVPLPLSTTASK